MRKKEQNLWDTFKRNAPTTFWLQRVENGVGEGMPDLYVSSGIGSPCWVELKYAEVPKRMTTPLLGVHGMRVSQIGWHKKALTKKIRSYILVKDSKGQLYLINGWLADKINDMPAKELRGCSLAADTWPTIFTELENGDLL